MQINNDAEALEALAADAQRRKDSERTAETQRNDAAEAEKREHAAALQTLTAERDTQKARADTAEAEVTRLRAVEQQRADAAERTSLERVATHHGIDPKATPDNAALRLAVASKVLGREVRADEGDVYVRQIVKAATDLMGARGDADNDPEGRADSRAAWASQDPPADQGTQRNDSGNRTADTRALSPSAIARKQRDDAFNAARSGGAK